ncbi:LysE family translocator [Saccharothrix sp. AJ9571]|nr:LysE family translocator [Saccharothrix sp. AJ9571]
MSETALLTWTLVAFLGVATPGIDTLLVLRHTLLGGRRAGLRAVTGIALGCLVWATASLAGLTALLAASEVAYQVVRIAGAAYLIWLGASALWKSLPRHRGPVVPLEDGSATSALRAGLLTNLLNPKVGVFYVSLLPQFLPVGPGSTAWGALLVTIHLAVTFAWYPLLVWTAARARRLLLRDRVRRVLDRLTATVLIGLGVKLATESR